MQTTRTRTQNSHSTSTRQSAQARSSSQYRGLITDKMDIKSMQCAKRTGYRLQETFGLNSLLSSALLHDYFDTSGNFRFLLQTSCFSTFMYVYSGHLGPIIPDALFPIRLSLEYIPWIYKVGGHSHLLISPRVILCLIEDPHHTCRSPTSLSTTLFDPHHTCRSPASLSRTLLNPPDHETISCLLDMTARLATTTHCCVGFERAAKSGGRSMTNSLGKTHWNR
jgi:hypothetical protein